MYNRYFKNILAILLSLNVFLASVGIPVYKHYCKGNLIGLQYLVEQENYCHLEHGDEDACCATFDLDNEEMSCCANQKSDDCYTNHAEDNCCSNGKDCNDCCENELELVKIDLLTILQTTNHLSSGINYLDIPPVYFPVILILQPQESVGYLNQNKSRSGPLPDGQSRVISYQKFIC